MSVLSIPLDPLPPTLALEKHQSDEGEGDSEMEKEREEEMVKEEEEIMKKEEEEGESERKWLEDAGFEHLVKEYENGKEVQEELGKLPWIDFLSVCSGEG